MKMMKRGVGIILLLAGVAAGLVPAFAQGQGAKPGPGVKGVPMPKVQVGSATQETISETLDVTGESVSPNTVTISPTVEGPIEFCPWREGDGVKEGETLVRIGRPLYEAEVAVAEATLEVARAKLKDLLAGTRSEEIAKALESVRQYQEALKYAESDFTRTEALAKKGAIPEDQLEKANVDLVQAKTRLASAKEHLGMLTTGPTRTNILVQQAQVAEAEARLGLAKARRDECVIKAPFTGVITRVMQRQGDMAANRAPVLELMETTSQVVRLAVPEKFAGVLSLGQAVSIRFDALPGEVFPASISRIFPTFDPKWRTRTVEAAIANPERLKPNMFARVGVVLQSVADAVVVPDEAIILTPDGKTFVAVVADGRVRRQPVTLGIRALGKVQITSGLSGGETVVQAAPDKLKDGQEVMPVVPGKGSPPAPGGKSPTDTAGSGGQADKNMEPATGAVAP